jgi:protein-tyrosine phosphatase
MIRLLFVCMGNICRSPTAQGVFDALIERHNLNAHIATDSAGTGAWHAGKSPDERAKAAAMSRGYRLDKYRARQVSEKDFEKFDLILAMDKDNLSYLNKMCPAEHRSKLKLLLSFGSGSDDLEVPDPYYGGKRGFDLVLELVEDACDGLLAQLRSRHNLPS